MQDIARNFVSGIIILIDRPIQIGDRIEVDKVAGQVSKIRASSTTVRAMEFAVAILMACDDVPVTSSDIVKMR